MTCAIVQEARFKSACPSPGLLAKGVGSGKYRYEEGALFKRCSICRDYWPADSEFFFACKAGDGLHCSCRACYTDRRYPKGRSKT